MHAEIEFANIKLYSHSKWCQVRMSLLKFLVKVTFKINVVFIQFLLRFKLVN